MAIPKNKTIINIDDYTGLRWNGKHTSELGLTVVSSSSRYSLNPISSISNNTVDVPGGDGQYYFSSQYGPKKWTINFVFDNLDDYQWRDLLSWLYHKETSDLVFDELPYKAYNAKLEGTPTINYLCFDETKAKYNDNSIDKDSLEQFNWADFDGVTPIPPSYITHYDYDKDNFDTMYYKKRIYKGEGTLNFVAFYPFGYSARDYKGKNMKYLDEIKYYPDMANKITEPPKMIGNNEMITKKGDYTLQINKIYGSTFIDENNNSVIREIIDEQDNILKISTDDKTLASFSLIDKDEENEQSSIYFDNVGNIYDTIEYNEETKEYSFIKRVNAIDLFKKKNFMDYLGVLLRSRSFDENKIMEINYDFKKLLSEDEWNNIGISINDDVNETILQNNYFKYGHPEDSLKEQILEDGTITKSITPCFYLENATIDIGQNTELKLRLHFFASGVYFKDLYNKVMIDDIEQNNACLLFYPQKPNSDYKIKESVFNGEKIETVFSDSISLKLEEPISNFIEFSYIPALYNNIREWEDSSGLRQSQYIEEENIYYDIANFKDITEADFNFKIYNGGDLPTPFRLNLPILKQKLENDQKEIVFALAKLEGKTTKININQIKTTKSVMDLKFQQLYGLYDLSKIKTGKITEDEEIASEFSDSIEYSSIENVEAEIGDIEYKYYLYKISSYENNEAIFIDKDTGNFVTVNLDDKKQSVCFKDNISNNLQVLDSFGVRYYNQDALNGYADIIQQYTVAAENRSDCTNKLEIDTYKQSINFISTSSGGKETIIPCYFMLSSGKLFNIPPKVDNLYLLVYNLRNKKNKMIDTSKKIEIDYKYLYL